MLALCAGLSSWWNQCANAGRAYALLDSASHFCHFVGLSWDVKCAWQTYWTNKNLVWNDDVIWCYCLPHSFITQKAQLSSDKCVYMLCKAFRVIYISFFLYIHGRFFCKVAHSIFFAVTVVLHLGTEKPEKLWQEARWRWMSVLPKPAGWITHYSGLPTSLFRSSFILISCSYSLSLISHTSLFFILVEFFPPLSHPSAFRVLNELLRSCLLFFAVCFLLQSLVSLCLQPHFHQ